MITVRLYTGQVLQFPDGTPESVIRAAAERATQAAAAQAAKSKVDLSSLQGRSGEQVGAHKLRQDAELGLRLKRPNQTQPSEQDQLPERSPEFWRSVSGSPSSKAAEYSRQSQLRAAEAAGADAMSKLGFEDRETYYYNPSTDERVPKKRKTGNLPGPLDPGYRPESATDRLHAAYEMEGRPVPTSEELEARSEFVRGVPSRVMGSMTGLALPFQAAESIGRGLKEEAENLATGDYIGRSTGEGLRRGTRQGWTESPITQGAARIQEEVVEPARQRYLDAAIRAGLSPEEAAAAETGQMITGEVLNPGNYVGLEMLRTGAQMARTTPAALARKAAQESVGGARSIDEAGLVTREYGRGSALSEIEQMKAARSGEFLPGANEPLLYRDPAGYGGYRWKGVIPDAIREVQGKPWRTYRNVKMKEQGLGRVPLDRPAGPEPRPRNVEGRQPLPMEVAGGTVEDQARIGGLWDYASKRYPTIASRVKRLEIGPDPFFDEDEGLLMLSPDSNLGTMMHELTHVAQAARGKLTRDAQGYPVPQVIEPAAQRADDVYSRIPQPQPRPLDVPVPSRDPRLITLAQRRIGTDVTEDQVAAMSYREMAERLLENSGVYPDTSMWGPSVRKLETDFRKFFEEAPPVDQEAVVGEVMPVAATRGPRRISNPEFEQVPWRDPDAPKPKVYGEDISERFASFLSRSGIDDPDYYYDLDPSQRAILDRQFAANDSGPDTVAWSAYLLEHNLRPDDYTALSLADRAKLETDFRLRVAEQTPYTDPDANLPDYFYDANSGGWKVEGSDQVFDKEWKAKEFRESLRDGGGGRVGADTGDRRSWLDRLLGREPLSATAAQAQIPASLPMSRPVEPPRLRFKPEIATGSGGTEKAIIDLKLKTAAYAKAGQPLTADDLPFELNDLPLTRWSNYDPARKMRGTNPAHWDYDRAGGHWRLGDSTLDYGTASGGRFPVTESFTPANPLILPHRSVGESMIQSSGWQPSPYQQAEYAKLLAKAEQEGLDTNIVADRMLNDFARSGGHDSIIILGRGVSGDDVEVVKLAEGMVGNPRTSQYLDSFMAMTNEMDPQQARESLQMMLRGTLQRTGKDREFGARHPPTLLRVADELEQAGDGFAADMVREKAGPLWRAATGKPMRVYADQPLNRSDRSDLPWYSQVTKENSLSRFANTVYREDDSLALSLLVSDDDSFSGRSLFVASSPELAISQHGGGVVMEFDAAGLAGQMHQKPGLAFSQSEGLGGEFVTKPELSTSQYRKALRSVELTKQAAKSPNGRSAVRTLIDDGWSTSNLPDGKLRLDRPLRRVYADIGTGGGSGSAAGVGDSIGNPLAGQPIPAAIAPALPEERAARAMGWLLPDGSPSPAGPTTRVQVPEYEFQTNIAAQLGGADDPQAQQVANYIIQQSDEVYRAIGPPQSWDTLEELAARAGTSKEDLLANSSHWQVMSPELRLRLLYVIKGNEEKIDSLQSKLVAGTATDADKADLLRLIDSRGDMVRLAAKTGSAYGRALNSLRMEARLALGEDHLLRQQLYRQYSKQIDADKPLLDALARLDPSNPEELQTFLRAVNKPSFREYVQEYWVASILSGPATHERNLIGNAVNAVMENAIVRPLAAGFDAARVAGAGAGADRAIYLSETPAAVLGLTRGIRQGMRRGWEVLRRGYDPETMKGKLFPVRSAYARSQNRVVREVVGPVVTMPLRLLAASDALFKTMNWTAEIHAQAARAASKAGLSGGEWATEVANLLANPTDEMISAADDFALKATFNDEASALGKAIMNLRDLPGLAEPKSTVGKLGVETYRGIAGFVLPFIKIADRLMVRGFEYTPIGTLKSVGARQAGNFVESADLAARSAIGSVVMAYAASLAMEGRLTAAAPSDEAEKAAFFRAQKQPWSVRTDDGLWIPYGGLQPVGTPFAMAASFWKGWTENEESPSDERLAWGAQQVGQYVTDQSYMDGLSKLIEAISGGKGQAGRAGADMLTNTAWGFAPYSGLTRSIAKGVDPRVIDAERIADRLWQNVPGVSLGMDARLTPWGEEVVPVGGRLRAGLAPGSILLPSKEKPNPIDQELDRLGMPLGYVGKTLSDKLGKGKSRGRWKLTPDEWYYYQQTAGRTSRKLLERLYSKPGYGAWDIERQREETEKAIGAAREYARIQTVRRHRGLGHV